MDIANPNEGSDSQNIATKAAALLLVIGEPFTEDHKKLILEEVTKGFGCWETEASGIDINDELAQIANKADLGEEGPDGERIIRHNTESFATEILVNPQIHTVINAVKNFLATPTKHKHLIHAGHAFQGSGAWILQDDTYTFNNFVQAFKDQDVSNSLKQQEGSSLYIYTGAGCDWSDSHVAGKDFSKVLKVKVNPKAELDNINGVLQFTAYVSNFVKVRKLNELLQSTDVVGNIRFSRPTLYIFPGCQGDSALFGMSGFNLLVNGGYSRKACFWDFTRHLDRIDAALVTHLGTDNLFGFSSVLQRKSTENVHPEIGYMYINASDKIRALTEQDNNENKEATLAVNLAEEGNKLIQYAKQIGQLPQPCTRSQTIEPINLYHKVGIGSMDMYILNPITDSKELKEFYQQWNQRVAQFGISQHVPLPNNLSVCALLVWRPSDPNDNITRIFFPGNAPQHKVLEGLEKLKTLNILKSAKCTQSSLSEKPVKKPGALASKAPVRSKVSPLPTPKNEAPTKSEPVKKVSSAPKPRPSSAQKAKKENDNKKTSKVAEKITKNGEKVDKAKSSASSSPSKSSLKSSAASTPKETSSPTKEAEQSGLEKVPNLIDHQDDIQPEVINGEIEQTASQVDLLSAPIQPETTAVDNLIGEPLPPQELVHPGQTEALDKEKLKELGIYDEDQDIEEDLNSQQDDKPEDDREQQMFGGMTDSMHEDLVGGLKTSDPMQSSFHGDLMTGSIHESMFDDKQPFDGFAQNGGAIEEVTTPEDDTSEEIQPQALPEPKAYTPATYGQEPDIIPSIALKEESQIVAESKLQPATVEPDLVPSKQENTDDLSLSQDVGDDSTIPVEDKSNVQDPVELETPDEIENVIPEDEGFSQLQTEDVQEKDITEQNEKEFFAEESETRNNEELEPEEDYDSDKTKPPAFDTFEEKCGAPPNLLDTDIVDDLQSTPSEQIICESKDEILQKELGHNIVGGEFDKFGKIDTVNYPEERDSDDQNEEELVTEDGFNGNDVKTTDLDTFEDKHEVPENGLDTEIIGEIPSAQTEQLADDSMESAEAEYEKDPQSDQSLEPEIAEQVTTSELEDAQPELERPKSPEPSEVEQEAGPEFEDDDDQIPVDSGMVEEISQVPPMKSESDKDTLSERIDSEMIENDYTEEEEKTEQFKKEESDELENAQVPVKQIETNDDCLTEDTGESLIPLEQEEKHMLEQERVVMPDSPDSEIERSGTPDSQVGAAEINRDSLEKEQVEEINHTSDMPHEQRDSIEKESFAEEESPALQDGQSEPRDSIERSFEDETDDSEEDDDDDEEDEDSSSFEQEEHTDEKCLIQDSVSEEPKGVNGEGDRALETDSLAAPPDSLMDQPTDNLMSPCSENMYTPESEMTDPSHGGQLGYHQMTEQDDADSVEGLEDNSELSPQQPPLDPVPVKEDYHHTDQHVGPTSVPTNPFDLQEKTGYNPFTGSEQLQHDPHQDLSSDDEENDAIQAGGPADFNPVAEWGEPMGLPSPAPPEDKGAASAKSPRPKSASKTLDSKKKDDLKKSEQKANGAVKKMDFRKPAATKKAIPSAKPSPKQSNGEAEKSKPKVPSANSSLNTSKVSSTTTTTGRLSLGGKTTASKMRPTSAPLNKNKTDPSTAKANGVKRPSTAAGTKSAASAVKMPPLPPFTPFYVDLTYIPNHGNTQYSDVEFFKRVRARYYVLSTLSPNTQVLDSLLDAKNTWEDKDLPVTVIPTYDNETLRLWMALHKEKLADQKVEIAPSANRCTIQLQDHETSCSAYRLEF